ncbi:PIN/TRAM domain-containing protein [Clostridium sp. YIM B02505]|uniref:PIN/TRAM domain-containing protein n=1 Tax=Clostridium yunnanense TaxID=2800325 RepID=A0ABS1ETF3_9CLOT|nr:PIN/TRAM domain-containing protein [Clostridium yunnanense]MBK1812578.1 PIN/TRAM domain-containing protein [Clostridium yunnanense]
MVKKLFRLTFTIIGLVVGYFIADGLIRTNYIANNFSSIKMPVVALIFYSLFIIIFGLILFIVSPLLYRGISKLIDAIESSAQKLTASEILFGALGAIISLIIASLFMLPLNGVLNKIHEILAQVVFIVVNLVALVIGVDISVKRRDDIIALFDGLKRSSSKDKKNKHGVKPYPKVLDTSVIIDGRIFDICQTAFVEGPLVIPSFVLDELRHISDSSDSLKRNRGRRGLDILNKIQKELSIEVQIWEGDFPDIQEVDSKLLKLAQTLSGKVVTNDYNLNKVAEFQGVPVLNINELANAIKPVVLPGEDMTITIVKDGKESGQGVAYLDDGTMIVVEGGRKFIGENIDVTVTSVLQTAAGRMIFAKQKEVV